MAPGVFRRWRPALPARGAPAHGRRSGGVRSDEGAPAAHPGRGHAYPFAGEVAVMTAPSCRRALLQADEGGPKADSRWVRGPVEASGPIKAGPGTPMMDGADRGPESPRRPGVTPAGGRRRSIAPPRQALRTSGPAARHGHRPLPVRGDPPTPPPAPGPQPIAPDPPQKNRNDTFGPRGDSELSPKRSPQRSPNSTSNPGPTSRPRAPPGGPSLARRHVPGERSDSGEREAEGVGTGERERSLQAGGPDPQGCQRRSEVGRSARTSISTGGGGSSTPMSLALKRPTRTGATLRFTGLSSSPLKVRSK